MKRTAEMDAWIDDAKRATVGDVLGMITLNLKGRGEMTGPCPACGGTDRFAVNVRKGKWLCRGCRPKGGSAIDLVMLVEGCDFLKACEIINGSPSPRGEGRAMTEADREARDRRRRADQERRDREAVADNRRRYESARGIWQSTEPLGGPAAEYLRSRGIDPKFADKEIRLHRGLMHPDGGTFPALVARVTDPQGAGVGVWRIFLKMDGSGKAPVSNPKLGLGVVTGGAVRLGGLWPRLAVAEGIETALAVRQFLYETTDEFRPVWPCLSTSGMAGLIAPDMVEHVDVFCDGDTAKPPEGKRASWLQSPGLKAAHDLKHNLETLGKTGRIHEPPPGTDWLDVANALRRQVA